MTTRCSICTSPNVEHINALIKSGRSFRSIAPAMGVSDDAIQRHVRNGHVEAAQAPVVPMPKSGDGPLDAMADLQAQLVALDAIAATSPSMQLQVLEARRRVVSDIAKIAPPAADTEGPSARKAAVLEEMIRVLEDVIEAHPEIRMEAARAMHAWKARRVASGVAG